MQNRQIGRANSSGNLKLLDQGEQNPRQFISLEIKLLEVRLHNSIRILQNVKDSCHLKNGTSGNDKKIATILLRKAARTLSPDFFGIQGNAQRSPTQLITSYRINRLIGNKPSHDLKMKSLGPLINNKFLEVEHLLWRSKRGVSVKQKE